MKKFTMTNPLSGPKLARLLLMSASLLSLLALAMPSATPAQAACAALPTAKGTVTMTVNAPSAATYRVWVRELAPTTNANGFYVQIADANACQITMGDAVIPVNTWTWVDYQNGTTTNKVNVTLSAGNHTVVMAGLDDGVEVDKIELLSDATCTPTGDGSNCTTAAVTPTPTPGGNNPTPTPTPTTVVIPPSGSGSSTPPTVSHTIAIAAPIGTTNAKCTVDGKSVDCASVDTTKLSDGTHEVTVTGTDASGKTIQESSTIKVKNHQTLWEQIVAGLRHYQLPILIVAGLILLIGALLYLHSRYGILSPVLARLGWSPIVLGRVAAPAAKPAVPAPLASLLATPPTPPAPGMIYPKGTTPPGPNEPPQP